MERAPDIDRVLELRRSRSASPAEIARTLGVDAGDVRQVLADHALLDARPSTGRPPRSPGVPLAGRAPLELDLIDLSAAANYLGDVVPSTVRRWIRDHDLPYRTADGRLTSEPFGSRWHRFSIKELDRWAGVTPD